MKIEYLIWNERNINHIAGHNIIPDEKKLLPIPQFNSLEEEAVFWDTHDSTDYSWEDIEEITFVKKITSVYKNIMFIKLDSKTSKAIEKVAKDKGIEPSLVGRMLLRERLAELNVI